MHVEIKHGYPKKVTVIASFNILLTLKTYTDHADDQNNITSLLDDLMLNLHVP